VSGIECIDELVTIFRRNEEDTFSLFNYIQVRPLTIHGPITSITHEPITLLRV
jgi:hypothetical protein